MTLSIHRHLESYKNLSQQPVKRHKNISPTRRKNHNNHSSTEETQSEPVEQESSSAWYSHFHKLPESTKSVLKRVGAGAILISGFLLLIYGGPVCIILVKLCIQVKCFYEILDIAYKKYEINNVRSFRYISIYFLIAANIFLCGENVLDYFTPYINRYEVLRCFATYHRFISFCIYFLGVIWFVLSLKKKYYRNQFSLLAWTHILLLVVVSQSYLIVKTIFQGLIWFVLCITVITINDIMAYFCGKLYGKTPLIRLSPKKTWEGFIGAGIFTVLIGCFIAYLLSDNEYFICPIEYREMNGEIVKLTICYSKELSTLITYQFFSFNFSINPLVVHAFWLSIFGSVVAPFGGFFASGFKRAFKVKDFGDSIPGHGGLMDRFDCQLVMITFVNVYLSSFIGNMQVDKVFEKIMDLNGQEQLELFYMLKNSLNHSGFNL